MDYRGLSWTAAARKHRVSRDSVRQVVDQPTTIFTRPAEPPLRPDEALLFLGRDAAGEEIEVVGVELSDGRLRIIHAMPMRPAYRALFEGEGS